MDIQSCRAIITGGGTGIGKGIALRLNSLGAQVAIVGRREDKLKETAEESQGPHPILTFAGDVANREQTLDIAQSAREQLGGLDLLVNAAGTNIPDRSIKNLSPDDWDLLMNVNATGTFNWIHATLPSLVEQKSGLIVNISSIAGKRATVLGGVAYNASKFAQSALGITTGVETGSDGVRVTNIYPGETNTPILDARPQPPDEAYRAQLLQPEDIADIVVAIAQLPDRAQVPELVITPTSYPYF